MHEDQVRTFEFIFKEIIHYLPQFSTHLKNIIVSFGQKEGKALEKKGALLNFLNTNKDTEFGVRMTRLGEALSELKVAVGEIDKAIYDDMESKITDVKKALDNIRTDPGVVLFFSQLLRAESCVKNFHLTFLTPEMTHLFLCRKKEVSEMYPPEEMRKAIKNALWNANASIQAAASDKVTRAKAKKATGENEEEISKYVTDLCNKLTTTNTLEQASREPPGSAAVEHGQEQEGGEGFQEEDNFRSGRRSRSESDADTSNKRQKVLGENDFGELISERIPVETRNDTIGGQPITPMAHLRGYISVEQLVSPVNAFATQGSLFPGGGRTPNLFWSAVTQEGNEQERREQELREEEEIEQLLSSARDWESDSNNVGPKK